MFLQNTFFESPAAFRVVRGKNSSKNQSKNFPKFPLDKKIKTSQTIPSNPI
jgi:hypothetical protein